MHIQTHILSGWCLANMLPLSPRERLFSMIAATLPDIDGISFIFGQEAYWNYHHILGHNLLLGLLSSAVLAAFLGRRIMAFFVFLGLFHLHLAMDYFGSGPEWPILYFWPVSRWQIVNHEGWEFFSWQNQLAFCLLFIGTLWIAYRQRRTPLEFLMPQLDRKLVRGRGSSQI